MSDLVSVLNGVVSDGTLLTVRPGGNYGDSLIYRGFDAAPNQSQISFDRVRFSATEKPVEDTLPFPNYDARQNVRWIQAQIAYLRHKFVTNPDVLYLHGGGNFNDIWSGGIQCYEMLCRYFDGPVVVGPQSCTFDETDPRAIFEAVDNRTYFFCRDRYSYDIMRDATASLDHVSVHLDHDTALSLSRDDLPAVEEIATENYTLVSIRSDSESNAPMLGDRIDPPIRVMDISVDVPSFKAFVSAADRASEIITDRLHVAILATILDTPVSWYPTTYHKARGVYEHSIPDTAAVDFHE